VLSSTVPPLTGRDLDRAVTLRLTRQQVLEREDPLTVWAVVDESALRRRIGSAETHRAQLEHLVELAERPGVALQVLPTETGLHVGGGPFSILRFDDPELPDVVYVESLVGASYVDKTEHVERYVEVMNRLSVESLTPDESVASIRKLLVEDQ
jgi:hypothetical protein